MRHLFLILRHLTADGKQRNLGKYCISCNISVPYSKAIASSYDEPAPLLLPYFLFFHQQLNDSGYLPGGASCQEMRFVSACKDCLDNIFLPAEQNEKCFRCSCGPSFQPILVFGHLIPQVLRINDGRQYIQYISSHSGLRGVKWSVVQLISWKYPSHRPTEPTGVEKNCEKCHFHLWKALFSRLILWLREVTPSTSSWFRT